MKKFCKKLGCSLWNGSSCCSSCCSSRSTNRPRPPMLPEARATRATDGRRAIKDLKFTQFARQRPALGRATLDELKIPYQWPVARQAGRSATLGSGVSRRASRCALSNGALPIHEDVQRYEQGGGEDAAYARARRARGDAARGGRKCQGARGVAHRNGEARLPDADAPATISRISCVTPAWRMRL